MAEIEQLTRQRVDYRTLPGGMIEATLTVTGPNGFVRRFTQTIDPNEPVAGDEVGSLFGSIGRFIKHPLKSAGNIIKKVGKVAKAVVTNKLFLMAAGALATAIPGAGPIVGPALLVASKTLGVAAKLGHARIAAKHGAHATAKLLTAEAVQDAHKLTGSPQAAQNLLKLANEKSQRVERLTGMHTLPNAEPIVTASTAAAPAASAASGDELLRRARAGRVRSNRPGPITEEDLRAAHASGRVFWVS
jgi:hypothetical protein